MTPDPAQERLRAEQIRMLYRTGPPGAVAALAGACVLALILWYASPAASMSALAWLSALVVITFFHVVLARAYWRRQEASGDWRRWARRFTAFSFLEGLIWGSLAIYLAAPQAAVPQLLAMAFVATLGAASISAYGLYLPAFYALCFPAAIPFGLVPALQGGLVHEGIAMLVLVYLFGMWLVAGLTHANLTEMLRLRFENADLAAALKLQMEAAQAASLAKTQFLAAASHDLRQPVHALSLFVGALRGYELAEEPRKLVDRIEESVESMDGLFSALLDISRLDAGVVVPELQVFAVQPLLDRLRRDYAEEAAAKGLEFRVRPSPATVRSDPVLLERILRNLVSNAVRYTDRGGVLVGCRPGAPFRIEVWDTGRGIPQHYLARVFEEFFQLDNPERDRNKGLGLGLAIVRRLAGLLEHRLNFTSVPGRGSMFSIAVPAAPATVVVPAAPAADGSRRGLILVVDDETAIQEGMCGLLKGWGHHVLSAGSGDEILARVAACAGRPDLLICDYRLRGGETGAEVIGRIREKYVHHIPAMLITGDTAPDRLEEASGSGLLLLHKPVSNSRLRAAVNNLLRAG